MWVYKTGQFEGNPIVLYDYEVGRSGEFAKKFLSGFWDICTVTAGQAMTRWKTQKDAVAGHT